MEKIVKPRILLDRRMLAEINAFYHSRLSENILSRECFSHPDMESHICNIKAPLDGGLECDHCKHIVGRRCSITCHIHHFCLAVFAYRLGVGGEDLWRSIKNNSERTSYNQLQKTVMEIISVDGEVEDECGEAQDISTVKITEAEEQKRNSQPPPVPPHRVEEAEVSELNSSDADLGEYITVLEAADLYGCSYFNMYSHCKRGNLEKFEIDGKQVVKKADVLELKSRKGTRKRRKINSVPEKQEQENNVVAVDIADMIRGLPEKQDLSKVESEVESEEYLTVSEAADFYGCSYVNMHAHIRRGNLEKVEVGGKQVVRKSDVLNLTKRKKKRV